MLTVALGCLSVGVGFIAGHVTDQPEPVEAVYGALLFGTLIVAGLLQLTYRYRNHVEALDLFEAVLAPLIIALPGLGTVAVAAAAKAISQYGMRVRPAKAWFNTAQWSVAAAAGTLVFGLLRSPGALRSVDLVWLVPAVLSVSIVNQLAFVAVLCLADRRSPRDVLAELVPVMVSGWVIGGGIVLTFGVLFAAAFCWAPLTVPLFAVPLWLLHWASRSYGVSLAHRARLRGLQQATHVLAVPVDPRQALPEFLEEVRKCFGAELVELVVCERGSILSWTADVDRAGTRRTLTLEERESRDPLLRTLVEERRALEISAPVPSAGEQEGSPGPPDQRDCLAAPVFAGDEVTGMLCAYNRNGYAGSHEGELGIVTALAGEVSSALEKAGLLDTLNAEREKLAESEARFRVLVQDSSDMVCVVGPAGSLCYASPAFGRLVGTDAARLGSDVLGSVHAEDRASAAEMLSRCASAPATRLAFECRVRSADGTWRHVENLVQNLLDNSSINGLVLNSRDITDRKRAERILAGQARVLESIARDAPLRDTLVALIDVVEAELRGAVTGIVVDDPTNHIRTRAAPHVHIAVIDELDGLLAGPGSAARRASIGPLVDAEIVPDLLDDTAKARHFGAARERGFRSVWLVPILAPENAHTLGALAIYRSEAGAPDAAAWNLLGAVARLVDVAIARLQSQANLAHQATHDNLTGLPNRILFADRLAAATARVQRRGSDVAVMFIDLDRFKAINDGMGHDAGDKLLVACAGRLRAAVRPWDTVARFGGDEFIVLCEDVNDDAEAAAMANRIHDALAAPIQLTAGEVFVSASIGIARASASLSTDVDELLESADRAMYQAKRQGGKSHVFFDRQLQTRMRHRVVLQTELHHAIERRQFCLFYQPIMCIESGLIAGVEALLRWNHPSRGLIGPADFIDEAEDSGLIVDIGRLVIEDAARQATRWGNAGLERSGFTVSVNLSALQFARHDLVDTVARTIEAAGADPSAIHFEITESVLMEDIEATRTALSRLKALGVGLVIDDFGTGYSSLSYLKRFPVDGLKIDQSFVKGLGFDKEDSAIASAVINLAHTLDLVAIAEGVETGAQLERLQDLGCDYAQGYYLGRPQLAANLPTFGLEGAAR